MPASSGGCVPLIMMNNADGAGVMGYGAIDGRGGTPMLIGGNLRVKAGGIWARRKTARA
jgi:hypothetical protein